MIIRYEKNRLIVDNQTVVLEQPVDEVLELPGQVIVLLQSDDYDENDPLLERNVLAIDERGKVLWRIEKTKGRFPSSYVSLFLADDGRTVKVYEWAGFEHDLDPNTGKLSNTRFTK